MSQCFETITNYYTRLMTFFFVLVAAALPPPRIRLATTHQNNRELMTWVDQHKTHNSPSTTSLIAKKTELAMAMVEAKMVNCFGIDLARNNQ